ncbi:MAG: bifunctional glycosyltransferase family 2/GtrA family protein, partial [Alphaproteobacteria bacterium]|nr:bifunctional glycosyltransferase family 2/GtrA family protein [Alphaproteobacteria bacterium]
MREPISLTLFFPAHNEQANLAGTIQDALGVAEESPYIDDYEILIINDGSTDATAAIAEGLAAENPRVRVINHDQNRGYGAALKTGLAAAAKDWVFFTDSDRQFDLLELQNLLVHIPAYDAVIAYRAPRRDPFMRLVNAKMWNVLNRILFGLRVRDIDCAFKLLQRRDVQSLRLLSRGAMINAELLIKLAQRGINIKEVPVSHLPRLHGSPTGAKPSVIFRALREMVMLYGGELGGVTHIQAVKFMAVGVINTLVDASLYIALTRGAEFFANHLLVATFLAFMAGTVSSLSLNRRWTFAVRARLSFTEVARFYAAVSLALFINVQSMRLLLNAGLYDILA